MRDIKFRAYQPHNSLHRKPGMYLVDDIVFYNDGVEKMGEVFLHSPGKTSESSEYIGDIHLMQYTGQKDRENHEIYEGDILEYIYRPKDLRIKEDGQPDIITKERRVVEWVENGQFTGFNISTRSSNNRLVIGNIYENKELLDTKGVNGDET